MIWKYVVGNVEIDVRNPNDPVRGDWMYDLIIDRDE